MGKKKKRIFPNFEYDVINESEGEYSNRMLVCNNKKFEDKISSFIQNTKSVKFEEDERQDRLNEIRNTGFPEINSDEPFGNSDEPFDNSDEPIDNSDEPSDSFDEPNDIEIVPKKLNRVIKSLLHISNKIRLQGHDGYDELCPCEQNIQSGKIPSKTKNSIILPESSDDEDGVLFRLTYSQMPAVFIEAIINSRKYNRY